MIKYTIGNIITSETEAVVNTVNTQGVMGKGIALSFKEAFPMNFKIYKEACKEDTIDIGKLLLTETGSLYPKYIINFPTKKHWRNSSKYEYIEAGLKDLIRIIQEKNIKSISIPPLGAGNGHLIWNKVKDLINKYLSQISSEVEILVFEPGYNDQRVEIKKEVGLTAQRALYVYLLANYQVLGYQINLLVAHKIAYFLQIFGENLNLSFEKGDYGPYAHRLTHLLKHINHVYISYNDQRNSPTTIISINQEKYDEVKTYYNEKLTDEQKSRTDKLLKFIEGFESSYGLELLATIKYIVDNTNKKTYDDIQPEIAKWTKRKSEIMKPNHIILALNRLHEYNLV